MASSVVDLPKDTLRIMQTVLTRLQKSRGPVSMEKLWSGVAVNDVKKTRTAHKKSDVGEGGALHTLENAKDAFKLLARSCGERLTSLRTEPRTLPSRPGLHSLSDEILSSIFERVLYNTRDNQIKETIEIVFGHAMRYFCRTGDDLKLTIEVTLSHVSRRFRKLSLSNPKLWTRVCSLMHPNWISLRLERSKNAELEVQIGQSSWTNEIDVFMKLVIPQISRWRMFGLYANDLNPENGDFNHAIKERYGVLSLPALETLNITLNAESYVALENPRGSTFFDFYGGWDMPRLRHMRSHNHLHKPLLGKQCITTFAFTQEIDRMGQCSIPSLLPILESYENLQDLSLNVAGYEYNPRSRDVIVELPHLESLSLELHLKGAIISLMPSLVLPKLRRLTFEVDDEDDETSPLSEWLQLLLGCGYPSLIRN